MYRSLLIALCSLLALGGVLSTGLAGQAGRQEEDLTKRVVRLEAALKQATATVTEQGRTQRDLDQRLNVVESWLGKVPAAMVALQSSVEASAKAGFAYPAPNARSKELLLDALRKLGADLSAVTANK